MEKEHEETLLQTIQAYVERDMDKPMHIMFDEYPMWQEAPINPESRTSKGLYQYFIPAYQVPLDKFGQSSQSNTP